MHYQRWATLRSPGLQRYERALLGDLLHAQKSSPETHDGQVFQLQRKESGFLGRVGIPSGPRLARTPEGRSPAGGAVDVRCEGTPRTAFAPRARAVQPPGCGRAPHSRRLLPLPNYASVHLPPQPRNFWREEHPTPTPSSLGLPLLPPPAPPCGPPRTPGGIHPTPPRAPVAPSSNVPLLPVFLLWGRRGC